MSSNPFENLENLKTSRFKRRKQDREKHKHRKSMSWWRWGLFVFGAWIVAAAVLLGLGAFDAYNAQAQAKQLRGSVTTEAIRSGEFNSRIVELSANTRRAHKKFSNPLLYPVRAMPFVGRQFQSVVAITGVANDVTDVAVDALANAATIEKKLETDRVGALKDVARLTTEANKKLDNADLGPNAALIGPLAEARNETVKLLASAQTTLRQASAGSEALATVIEDEQTYLLLLANNGEMRAGSGMFLSTGLVSGSNGRISLSDVRSVGSSDEIDLLTKWPGDLEDRWGWLGHRGDFRSLMLSPRFDVAAPIAKESWKKRGGKDVDGVMVVDPVFFQAILKATGPVEVDGSKLDANNVLRHLLVEQYEGLNLSTSTVNAQLERRQGLAGIAEGAFNALDSGNWNPVTMARELAGAASGRHLMVWASDETDNERWRAAGLSGEIGSNSLLVASSNTGANKLDQFIQIDSRLDHRVGANGPEMTLTIKMENTAPDGLPAYVSGPTPRLGLQKNEYSGILSVSVPGDSRDVRIERKPPLVTLGPDGPSQVIATVVKLKQGESKTFVVKFTRSPRAQYTIIEPSARQPGINWKNGSRSWIDDAARLVQH